MKVFVLLATYNGARFLPEQLRSLEAQSFSDFKILARDDGSSDETLSLLRAHRRVELLPADGLRLGPAQSFARLAEEALKRGADVVFFCDQDDVWLREKIALSLPHLKGKSPQAVYTDLRLIDEAGKALSSSFHKQMGFADMKEGTFFRLLAQNFVTGCTLSVNRAALELALPVPAEALMHDHWLALLVSACGKLTYLREPTVLYRQHAGNATGGAGAASLFKKARRLKSGGRDLLLKRLSQTRALDLRLQERCPGTRAARDLHALLKLLDQEGRRAFAFKAWELGLRAQGPVRTGLFYLLLLASKLQRQTHTTPAS